MQLDVSTARIAHLNWTLAIESMVSNPERVVEIDSSKECELGRWIQTTGLCSYGHFDAVNLLVRTHQHFHEVAHEMVDDRFKEKKLLTQELNDLLTLSRDIVYFLTELELDILELKHRQQVISHPITSFMQRIIHGPHHASPDDHGPLNVSFARLVHLNWVRSLAKSFRGWGHDAHLESEEACILGHWLRETDSSLRKKHIEINYLKAIHKKFHIQSEETILFLKRKSENAAQKSYTRALKLSREIIYILSITEIKLLDSGIVMREDSLI